VIVDRLALTGAAVKLSGDGRLDPVSNRLAAMLAIDLPQLKPLGTAVGAEAAGTVAARLDAEGPPDRLQFKGQINGSNISLTGKKLDSFRLVADVADLSARQASIDVGFRAYGLDGTLTLATELKGNSELVVPRFRLAAADSVVAGSLRVGLDSGL